MASSGMSTTTRPLAARWKALPYEPPLVRPVTFKLRPCGSSGHATREAKRYPLGGVIARQKSLPAAGGKAKRPSAPVTTGLLDEPLNVAAVTRHWPPLACVNVTRAPARGSLGRL